MDTRQRTAAAIALALASILGGWGSLLALPSAAHSLGIWPVGVATLACLIATRRQVPYVGALLAVGTSATLWFSGRPASYAVILGLGVAAQALLTWWLLDDRGQDSDASLRRPPLLTMSDLGRLLRAIAAGAVVLAASGLLAGMLTPSGHPLVLTLSVSTAGAASEVALLPLFCRMRTLPSGAGIAEQVGQWVALGGVIAIVFAPADSPPLAFLVFPVLAWICLRGNAVHARATMISLEVAAITLTGYGRGPLARPDLTFDVSVDTQTVLLAAFIGVTALQVLVMAVSIGEMRFGTGVIASERDRIRGIVESITSTAVICSDAQGLITLFNPGAERLLGYRADEVLGRESAVLYSPASVTAKATELGVADDFGAVTRELMDAGPVEMPFLRKDGVERSHMLSLNRVLDDCGMITGHVSTSEDITERIEAQKRLVDALEWERTATGRLREVDRVKDAFVSSVSHELRTPLTSILGYLELLQDGGYGDLNRRQDSAIDRVRDNCSRLLSLISDLLDLGRLQEGAAEPGAHLDLTNLVRTVIPILTPVAEARNVRLRVWLPKSNLPVHGQRAPLERVLINLVDNAVKFTEPHGRVDVRACLRGGMVVLEVADSGIGIPIVEQKRLFDRFFRSSSATTRAIPGSGLGLSITRTIVEQHGGRIDVTSEPDVGTTFTVRLPVDTTYASPPPDPIEPARWSSRVRIAAAQP